MEDMESFLSMLNNVAAEWDIENYKPGLRTKLWEDQHLESVVKGTTYSQLEDDALIKLGEQWIAMLTGRMHQDVSAITTLLALHLKDPTTFLPAIDPALQEPVVDNAYAKEFKQMNTAAYLSELSKEIELQLTVGLCTEGEEQNMTPGGACMIHSLRNNPSKTQAAFYPFMAAMLCRIMVKEPKNVLDQLRNVGHKFSVLYSKNLYSFRYCAPTEFCLDLMTLVFKPGSTLTTMLMKGFLGTLRPVMTKDQNQLKRVLNFTLMIPTSLNGLRLVQFTRSAMKRLKIDFPNLVNQVSCNGTKSSLEKLIKFWDMYETTSKDIMWPWSRVVNPNYLSNLRVQDNEILAGLLISIFEDDETRGAWKYKGLEISSYMHSLLAERARQIRSACGIN